MRREFDTLQLRPALPREATAMAEMSRDLVEAGLGWRYTPSRMAALIAHPETVTLVACQDAQIRGLAVMHFGDELAHLALLCVDPTQRRRGIASRLTDWLVVSAQVAGIASISLEVRADNQTALAFYRQLGFSELALVPGYYSGQVDAQRMARSLRPDAGRLPAD